MTGSWRRTVLDPIGLVVAGLRLTEVDTGTVRESDAVLPARSVHDDVTVT